MALTFGSLFSGIGGFDLGFERAGMRCAWQVEIDAKARQVLDKHWPDVPKVEDVRDVRAGTVSAVDVICGGFPCQDVSVAGRRAGLAGERSGLWFEFHRILDELHPRWTVIENVPGLLSSNGGADFAVILSGLVECGYRVCWRVLDAQYFGLAQRRRRVFIVGSLGDGSSASILFESYPQLFQENGPELVLPCLTTQGNVDNGGGGWVHGVVIQDHKGFRKLTYGEQEQLQGFPLNWTDSNGDDEIRYRQLGNAVAVPVAEWIGRRIVALEEPCTP